MRRFHGEHLAPPIDIPDDMAEALGLHYEPGWLGIITRHEAKGAYPNGTRVEKVDEDPGDTRPLGSLGTVLGSLRADPIGTAYFVEWDSAPRHSVLVTAWKIARHECT